MRAVLAVSICLCAALGCPVDDPWRASRPSAPPPLDLPALAPGRLVAIWEWGDPPPFQSKALVVADAAGTRVLELEAPTYVTWLTPSALLVTAGWPPPDHRVGVLRLSGDATSFEEWTRDSRIDDPRPSPDRQLLANGYADQALVPQRLEILRLEPGLALAASRAASGSPSAWSPDGKYIAVSRSDDPRSGRIRPTWIEIVSRDATAAHALEISFRGKSPNHVSALPFAWARSGVVARVDDWVSVCDPDTSTCRPLWKPPGALFAVQAVMLSGETLLVGLADAGSPYGDTRVRELYRLDLASGRAVPLFRTPDGAFLRDFDWIESREADPR